MEHKTPSLSAREVRQCRVCGNTELISVVDIGEQYLSSVFPEDLILDRGGNEGTLFSFLKEEPYQLLNIDPAKNVVALVDSPRYRAVNAFFSEASFRSVSQKKAKLIF